MQRGEKIISPHFVLYIVTAKNVYKNEPARIGIIVSQKYSKKASARNLLRRRITEILRLFILPKSMRGFSAVLRALPGKSELNFTELRNELPILFHKTKVI